MQLSVATDWWEWEARSSAAPSWLQGAERARIAGGLWGCPGAAGTKHSTRGGFWKLLRLRHEKRQHRIYIKIYYTHIPTNMPIYNAPL